MFVHSLSTMFSPWKTDVINLFLLYLLSTRWCCTLALISLQCFLALSIQPSSIQGDMSTAEHYPRAHPLPLQAVWCCIHAGHVAVTCKCMHHLGLWLVWSSVTVHKQVSQTVKLTLMTVDLLSKGGLFAHKAAPGQHHTWQPEKALLSRQRCWPQFFFV